MSAIAHPENFVVQKKLYSRHSLYRKGWMDVQPPQTKEDLTYQAQLSEANQSFFSREYNVALEMYLELRQLILVQSDPQMPDTGGLSWVHTIDLASFKPVQFIELGRKLLEQKGPSGPGAAQLRPVHVVPATVTSATRAAHAPMGLGVSNGNGAHAITHEVARPSVVPEVMTQVGIFRPAGVLELPLAQQPFHTGIAKLYQDRMRATTLDGLLWHEEVSVNFPTYLVHLFFFTLPIAIGDTYAATGRYADAEREYLQAANYAYLNTAIETRYLWLKLADLFLRWGDELFRKEQPTLASAQYEKVLLRNGGLPGSAMYQGHLASMVAVATEALKEINGQPHGAVNPNVTAALLKVRQQLLKITSGLNFLGLSDDTAPVFRFKFLRSAATYLADQAIQCERTFINFRTAAENQRFERMQLQNNLDIQRDTLRVEERRLDDADLEVDYATATRDYAQLREAHAQDTLNDWNTLGRDLASVNAALDWANSAANDTDISYTGIRYRGERHDFDTDVEEFVDVVGEWRESLNFEIQQNRLERQVAESAQETAMTQLRLQQANVRRDIQRMSVMVAEKRVEGAQQLLDYSQDRMFDEELWFQLAAQLQDLARNYLDMAIYGAFLMERSYALEFDRSLGRIRFDYGIGVPGGLLGGDLLKRDIDYFTYDLLQHAQKKEPVRYTFSLREQFPAEYEDFIRTGILPFRTDLEMLDRAFPGTFRRKIKKVELFVEGLVPLEGATGYLHHQGLSTEWAANGGTWEKRSRVTPPEHMVISSYQFRRDYSVFQPSEELLGVFEHLGPQGNWTLELPRSGNDLDHAAISDVKFVLYFDAEYSAALRAFQSTFYPSAGGRAVVLSSRFHFPDQYFRLDADRSVTFTMDASRFAQNQQGRRISNFGVRLLDRGGAPITGIALTIRRISDDSTATGTTDATGAVLGDSATMAPFAVWKDAPPEDAFMIAFPAGMDLSTVGDVQLALDYSFTYRADGVLPA